jgi:hypothetical protein
VAEADVLAAEDRPRGPAAGEIAVLPDRQRQLMTLLATEPEADYEHISATLEMPIGSIGPTRAAGCSASGVIERCTSTTSPAPDAPPREGA